MSKSLLRVTVLPSLVYPYFELRIEQDEIRKPWLIKQETNWNEWINVSSGSGLPSLVYPYFELHIEQDEIRKPLLIR